MTSVERKKKAEAARRHLHVALANLDELGWHQPGAVVDHALHLVTERERDEAEHSASA